MCDSCIKPSVVYEDWKGSNSLTALTQNDISFSHKNSLSDQVSHFHGSQNGSMLSYMRKFLYTLYRRLHHFYIPFIFGIVIGVCITTLLVQYFLVLNSHLALGQPYILGKELKPSQNFDKVLQVNSHADQRIKSKKTLEILSSNMVQVTSSSKTRLYVGVITAEKFLFSRAVAVNNTWGQMVDKIEFFTKFAPIKYQIPVVNLDQISDNEYPPQKKSFYMLKHMCSHHINDFDWFIRADDDVYIRVEKLKKLLFQIDTEKMIHMGQPGRGVPGVRTNLGLNGHNFCMGGPGVIFNRNVLKELCPHIDTCMNEVVSREEDVEIGRCVTKHLRIECTHAWENMKLFYHAYRNDYKTEKPFLGNLFENPHVRNAITVHPLKSPSLMYRIHRHYSSLQLNSVRHNLTELEVELMKLGMKLPDKIPYKINSQQIVESPLIKPQRMHDVIPWKSFTTTSVSCFNPSQVNSNITNDIFADLKQVCERSIDIFANEFVLQDFSFGHVQDGLYRTDYTRGTDYYINMELNSKEKRISAQVRRVHVFRPSGRLEISQIRKTSQEIEGTSIVTIVVVRQSELSQFEIFMRNFYAPVLLAKERSFASHLIVVQVDRFKDSIRPETWYLNSPLEEVFTLYKKLYPSANLIKLPLISGEMNDSVDYAYARGIVHAKTIIKDSHNSIDKAIVILTSIYLTLSTEVVRTCHARTFFSHFKSNFSSHTIYKFKESKTFLHSHLYQSIPFHFYSSASIGPRPTAVRPQGARLKPGSGKISASMVRSNFGFWDSSINNAVYDLITPLCGRFLNLYDVAKTALNNKNSFRLLLYDQFNIQNMTLVRSPDRSYSSLPER